MTARERLERIEVAVERVHDRTTETRLLLESRWQTCLCDCGRMMGSPKALRRCEFCYSPLRHGVELQLTPASAAALILERPR